MKFKISKNRLLSALNVVSRAISIKNPNPILTGIKFELNQNGLYLTGSDSDISILTKVSTKENDENIITIQEYGVVVISSKYILDIIRKLEGEKVEFEIVDKTALVRDEKSEFRLNCLPSENYPPLEIGEEGISFTIEANKMKEVIEQVIFATSNNEIRPVLTGVNFKSNNGVLTCVATDSFRLARKTINIECDENFSVTIPSKTLNEISRVLENERTVKFDITEKRVCFRMVHTIIVSRVISNPYPNTDQLIPTQFKVVLGVNGTSFVNAIDRASLLSNDNMNIVQLSTDPEDVRLTSRNQEVGSVVEKIENFQYSGDKLDISFSAKYGMEAIRALGSDKIELKFNDPTKPFIVVNPDDPSIVQLILPTVTY